MFTKAKNRLIATAAAAVLVGVGIPVASAPAFAEDCGPIASHETWATPDAAYDSVTMNACAARNLSDQYGNSSGYTGVVSFISGLIPTWPTRTISAYFGLSSMSSFFTGGQIASCTQNYTVAAKLVFANGTLMNCTTLSGGGGM